MCSLPEEDEEPLAGESFLYELQRAYYLLALAEDCVTIRPLAVEIMM